MIISNARRFALERGIGIEVNSWERKNDPAMSGRPRPDAAPRPRIR